MKGARSSLDRAQSLPPRDALRAKVSVQITEHERALLMIYRELTPDGRDLADTAIWREWARRRNETSHGRRIDAAFADLKAGDLRVHVFDRFVAAFQAKGGAR